MCASLSESFSLYFCCKKDDQEGTCKLNLQKFKWFSENCICDALRDLGSVTIWRLHDRSNVCECMLTLFSTFMSFLPVCMSQHGIQTVLSNDKRLNAIQAGKHTSNLMTFECCFLISQYHESCNAMSSFTVLHHVPWNFYLHCSSMFSLFVYYILQ